MGQMERVYKLENLLATRVGISRADLLSELGVSPATLKRDLEYMRDRLNAPIIWDRELRGYRFEEQSGAGRPFQLPGSWFSEEELLAFATFQHLLTSLDAGGPVAAQLKPLMERLNNVLGNESAEVKEIQRRVKLLSTSMRRDDLAYFQTVGAALVRRQRLKIGYDARGRPAGQSQRVVSPQRLIHYRSNWYLGAWCHQTEGIRTFSLDAISACTVLEQKAKQIAQGKLAAYYDGGYGIFGGESLQWAKLKFVPRAARYVEGEIWHAEQRGRRTRDGGYILEVPYSMPRELVMDILRHGEDVEVLGPASLRAEVEGRVRALAAVYGVA